MLVDAKQVAWDDAAFRHLPEFELYDSYASHEMTVRDLLSHRSGLSRGDLMWYGSDLSRDEIVRRARFLEPSWSFRSQFGYQNIMYLTAGQIVERVSGMSWDDFVATRIFEPLGMSESNTSVHALAGLENVASPHAEIEDEVIPISWRNIDNIGPAGSVNSNVVDMAQWVRLHLNDGEFEDTRILSSSVVQEMQKPNTIVQRQGVAARLFPAANFQTYGMGWFLQDHRAKKLVQHGGNIDGMSAMVALMPSEKVGVVILTNMNGTSLRDALMLRIMDAYVGVSDKDWSTDIYDAIKPLLDQQKEQANEAEEERVTGTSPTHEFDAYVGTYVDPDSMYGEAEVSMTEGQLTLAREPAFDAELEHWHYNTFRATWADPMLGKSFVTFSHDHEGKVDEMAIQGIGTFDRKPEIPDSTDAIELSETQLRTFVGRYTADQPPLDLSVEFLDGRLQAVLPGQPAYVMATVTETSFRLTGIPIDVTMDFELQNGEVTAVVLTQQGASFTLTRVR
jgi:CubicO group peptidase (beta-lactamase class C family)